MRSQLKNIMKIEVMKKMKQLTSTKHLKPLRRAGGIHYHTRYKISQPTLEHLYYRIQGNIDIY